MTKIEELEQKLNEASSGFEFVINEIRKELVCYKTQKELKESKKENVGKWKPQIGEEYWFKNDIGKVSHSTYMCSVDECRANSVPLFKTQEQCERYWRFMDAVKEKSYEFSREEWEDESIAKYLIEYYYLDKEFCVEQTWHYKELGTIYFKDEESAQYIIDNFKDELMKFFI